MSKFDPFHLRWRGRITGPFSWAEIERKLDAHEIGLLHDLQQGPAWITLGEYIASRAEAVRANVNAPPTGADFKNQPPSTASSLRSHLPNRWIFVGLGLICGFLGAHDFYADHWIRGSIILAITALLIFLDWGVIWPWLWAIGEIILTKVDGKGRRMTWTRFKPPQSPPPPPPQ